ncbi:MAG: hypothetical protein R2854_11185 [Caldilineaceae bacterium]
MFGLNLWISGPLALRNFLTVATRRSILIKDGRSLDLLTEIDTVVFDKTGTLTLDQPHVTHIHTFADVTAQDVLRYAAAANIGKRTPSHAPSWPTPRMRKSTCPPSTRPATKWATACKPKSRAKPSASAATAS